MIQRFLKPLATPTVRCMNSTVPKVRQSLFLRSYRNSPYGPRRRNPNEPVRIRRQPSKEPYLEQESQTNEFTNPRGYQSIEYHQGRVPNSNGFINEDDGVYKILSQPTLVIERQVEMMNVFLGFEQANKYTIMDAMGNRLGSMMERDIGFLKVIGRQFFRLHRPFEVDVFDIYDNHVLTIKRPFSFINSHIKAILPGFQNEVEGIIGESVQSWHLWRRRYNLFKMNNPANDDYDQFGVIDSPFLSFDFPVRNENGDVLGSVDRNWVGLGREMFTDTGVYIIRMDPASFGGMGDIYPSVAGPMTLDQRAILLGNAISIDFDYFSRHSGHGGGLFSFGGYDD